MYVVFAVCTAAADRTERTSNEEVHNISSSSGNSTNYSLISLHINQIAHTFTAPPLPFCTLYIVNEPMMTTTTTSTTMGTESPGLPLTRAKPPLFLSPILNAATTMYSSSAFSFPELADRGLPDTVVFL